jgi:phytanoyl-CoA dioxygenase PhyH
MYDESPQIDQETRARFNADGVVRLRGILPPSSVAALGQAVDDIASKGGGDDLDWIQRVNGAALELAEVRTTTAAGDAQAKEHAAVSAKPAAAGVEPAAGGWPAVWRRNIVVRVIALDSVLPQLAASILGANKVNFCGDHVEIQEPNAKAAPGYGRDESRLPVTNGSGCTMWIALDAAPEGQGVSFLPGSQRWPDRGLIRAGASGTVDGETPLRFAAQPGDLLIYDLRAYRCAGPNASARRRRAIALHYCAEDMRFRRRAGIPARALNASLKDGGILDSPEYPVVWPRPYPGFAIATLYENLGHTADNPRRGRK